MPRKPIIAGNWKMFKSRDEASAFVTQFAPLVADVEDVDIVLCPTFTGLHRVKTAIENTRIGLGAQNCHFEESGAYTGEISAAMIKEVGCNYCIIGHSERRQYFAETDQFVNRKAQALYAQGITPIICVGETLDEREAGRTVDVITVQVGGCLASLPAGNVAASVIAYEPVWAIGTGKTATKEQAQEVHALIRGLVAKLFSDSVAQAVRIQYGGSVKPENAAELMAQPDVDGALVGGASLKPDSFAAIVKNSRG